MRDSSQGRPTPPLPPPFSARFDSDLLASQGGTLVVIDPRGTILWLNPAWYRFAEQNDGAHVTRHFDVGCCYFDGIAEPMRSYFMAALTDAVHRQTPFEQDYECSSPTTRRLMRLRALPVEGHGLLLEHSHVWEEPAAASVGEPPPAMYTDHAGFVVQCSNCRKVRRVDSSTWDWVPRFVAATLPTVSHGLCEVCLGFYWGTYLRRR